MSWWWLLATLLAWLTTAQAQPADGVEQVAAEQVAVEQVATTYDKPERVTVGLHLNDVQSIDLKSHSYAMDFYLWFRWSDPELDPSSSFELANPREQWGHVITPVYEEPIELEDGTLYQVVRFQGLLSRKLPLYNYPFDHQVLVAAIEDASLDNTELLYVVDADTPTMNPDILIPGYQLGVPTLTIETNAYGTRFGDPRAERDAVHSQARFTLPVSRPPVAYAAKLFLPVLAVVVCAALMFLLPPNLPEARVDVGITSLLTVVALQITYNDALPDVGYLMLMDEVYLLAYAFVILGLAVVVYTTRLAQTGEAERAVELHRRALIAVVTGWFAGMVVLVSSAVYTG
jgi:hypothetical protein